MVFMATLLNLAEFLITGNGLFVLVRVRLARRIRAGIADIENEFADAIDGLRLVPRTGRSPANSGCTSKHGILRHFRVEEYPARGDRLLWHATATSSNRQRARHS